MLKRATIKQIRGESLQRSCRPETRAEAQEHPYNGKTSLPGDDTTFANSMATQQAGELSRSSSLSQSHMGICLTLPGLPAPRGPVLNAHWLQSLLDPSHPCRLLHITQRASRPWTLAFSGQECRAALCEAWRSHLTHPSLCSQPT